LDYIGGMSRATNSDTPAAKRVAIYARVSSADGQTCENQIRELEAAAARHRWTVAGVYNDDGVSGATPRESRPRDAAPPQGGRPP
jgi:predicted site-specific integrase-resolvase